MQLSSKFSYFQILQKEIPEDFGRLEGNYIRYRIRYRIKHKNNPNQTQATPIISEMIDRKRLIPYKSFIIRRIFVLVINMICNILCRMI